MKLYDAHSHLHLEENSESLGRISASDDVIVCDCAVSESDFGELRSVAVAHKKIIRAAYGIHPTFIPDSPRDFPSEELSEYLQGACAVGEIGLDKICESDYESQKECFKLQLGLAQSFGLPAVLHCRKAWGDLLEILRANPLSRGVLVHAANCSPEIARELLKMGAVFSFGERELGSMRGLNCAASLPVGRILIESDADSSPPQLLDALRKIADLKNETEESMGRAMEETFLNLFGNG